MSWVWDYAELNSIFSQGVQSSIDSSVALMTMEGNTLLN